MRTLVGRTNPTSLFESVGLARTNFAIPNSLPAFYFEVRFIRDESYNGSIEAQLVADESDDDSSSTVENSSSANEKDKEIISDEVKKLQNSKDKNDENKPTQPRGLNIGVGLYREGIPLQGAPGEHNSYAYVV